MKKESYTEIICSGFCKFHGEGKDDLACETYNVLAERFAPGELKAGIQGIHSRPDFSHDEMIKRLVCDRCDFVKDGCDFREGKGGVPCGGYTIIEWLMAKGRLNYKKTHDQGR